jgi:tripartite-type tricarboxylate transporter receptor subunit TctC
LLLIVLLPIFGAAHAQTWPAKPVRIIVALSAGSPTDIVGRMVADHLSRAFGQTFIVENRAGGDGFIGATAAAKAPPDGYTLFLATQSTLAIPLFTMASLPYDPVRDFTPIAMLVDRAPSVIAVYPGLRANSVPELIALAKAQPGKLTFSSAASITRMMGQYLNKLAGIDMQDVSYKDTGQMIQDTVSGRIEIMIASMPAIDQFVKAGKLRLLGITTGKRFPGMERVPAIAETLPGYDITGWVVLVAPSGIPAEIVPRLNRATDTFFKDAEVHKRLGSFGWASSGALTPELLVEFIRAQRERWRTITTAIGVKPQ